MDAFESYFDNLLLNTMTYNETVGFLLEEMMKYGPRIQYLPMPKSWWQWIYARSLYPLIRIFTLGFLDPRFRARHGIEWSQGDEKRYRCYVAVLRTLRRITPRWARYSPFSLYIMLGGHGRDGLCTAAEKKVAQ